MPYDNYDKWCVNFMYTHMSQVGSTVVQWLSAKVTQDQGAVGSRLTDYTALCLWARTLILA